MRRGPGRHSPSGKRNPPGSKVARAAIEHAGLTWHGKEVMHGGALTEESNLRAGRRPDWPLDTKD